MAGESEKSVRNALIIQPPEDQWEKIQDIRREHDKAYARWMPHINLLYPFVDSSEEVAEKITKAVRDLQPFTISLSEFSFFAHSPNSCTLFLDPKPVDKIVELQSKLEKAFPECDDLSQRGNGTFVPHLTLGQFAGTETTEKMIEELSADWAEITFEVDKIHLISRTGNEPFSIVNSIQLGKENAKPKEKKKNRIAESLVDESVTLQRITSTFEDFASSPTRSACVFVNVPEVTKKGAGVNTRDVLFKPQKLRGAFICSISPTNKPATIRCGICERPVGKWKTEKQKHSIAVQGDFSSILSKFTASNICSVPIFCLPADIDKFCEHFSLPVDDFNNHEEFVASHARPSYSKEGKSKEELQEVVERVKRWIKKIEHLPTTRTKFLNATSSLRLLKSAVDPMLVLKCMAQLGKVNFCAPCRNYTITPAAYVRNSKSMKGDEVSALANRTVEWLCRQMKAPESVRALLDQIESFGATKEIPANDVWKALVDQGIVEEGEDMKYNIDAIHLAERPPLEQIDFDALIAASTPRQQQQHINFPFDKTVAKSKKQQKPEPLHNFDYWPICENLLRGIYAYGLEYHNNFLLAVSTLITRRPSLVQASVAPVLLSGREAVIQSQSGTGKTVAYCVPMLERIDVSLNKTQALVLVPSRELALAVSKVISSIGEYLLTIGAVTSFDNFRYQGIKSHVIVGGLSVKADVDALAKGPHVVVATCGRVLDMLSRKLFDPSRILCFVLDEADEMLSGNEKDQVYEVFMQLPREVQAILVSSTFSQETQDIWEKFMRDPCLFLIPRKQLVVGNVELLSVELQEEHKVDTLADILESSSSVKQTMVFCNSRRKVDFLTDQLRQKDFTVSSIHGDVCQNDRDLIFNEFKVGSSRVLITSNQLSRGIDIASVDRVFNYDFPPSAIEFYHRMGRAGRFGREGKCISFLTPDDAEKAAYVERFFGKKITPMLTKNL